MTRVTHFVGLDVHKDSIAISVAEEGREPATPRGSIPNDTVKLIKRLAAIAPPEQVLCCYEAGPTGFALCRQLRARGVRCEVVAPSLVPDRKGDRVKTDKRDSAKLAHFLRSGDLVLVWLPDEETEALRDLVRARDDAKITERVARQRLSNFLLRHHRIYPGKTAWTKQHLRWIKPLKFAHESQQRVLTEYLHAVEHATATVERVTDDVEELVRGSRIEPLANAFMALKGVRILLPAGTPAELGDLRRFPNARNLMSFVGLAVKEDSSGKRRRRFAITKTGSNNVRRLLVEAAWHYRHPPKMSYHLMKRCEPAAPDPRDCLGRATPTTSSLPTDARPRQTAQCRGHRRSARARRLLLGHRSGGRNQTRLTPNTREPQSSRRPVPVGGILGVFSGRLSAESHARWQVRGSLHDVESHCGMPLYERMRPAYLRMPTVAISGAPLL